MQQASEGEAHAGKADQHVAIRVAKEWARADDGLREQQAVVDEMVVLEPAARVPIAQPRRDHNPAPACR